MDNYHYQELFMQSFGATKVQNIAKAGSSNRRIIRTTVDYIEKNQVDFVIIGLTFYNRQESPLANKADPWVSYNAQGIQAVFSNIADYESLEQYRQIEDYVKSRYRYDINEHYLEQLYLDLRMFAAYLREKRTKFCIFNTCDNHHSDINLGPEFIPFTFVSNKYLNDAGALCMESDKAMPVNARHFYGNDVTILVNYLISHINNVYL